MKDSKPIQIFISVALVLLLTACCMTPAFADTDLPTENDLAQTIECSWAMKDDPENPGTPIPDNSDELVALAESLDNDPVKIYRWVYNNIYYPQYFYDRGVAYYRYSRLGARGAYLNKMGNCWDQSSLLIALLRMSGTPARYVYIEGIDTDGNEIDNIPCYAYVEAYIDKANYYSDEATQKDWVPMIPWLKNVDFYEGIELFPTDGTSTDPVPDGLDYDFSNYLSKLNNKNPLEEYEEKLQTYLNTSSEYSGKSLKDIPINERIIDKTSTLIPRSLPKRFEDHLDDVKIRLSEVPEEERSFVNLSFLEKDADDDPDNDVVLLSRKVYLPEIAGKGVALNWNYDDEDTDDFIPILCIDGTAIQEGIALDPAERFYIRYEVKDIFEMDDSSGAVIRDDDDNPVFKQVTRPSRLAGTYIQMGFDPFSASIKTIDKAKKTLQSLSPADAEKVLTLNSHGEYLGLMGQMLVETFLNRMHENSKKSSAYFHSITQWSSCPTFVYVNYDSLGSQIKKDPESKFYYHPQWNIDAQSYTFFYKWDHSEGRDRLMEMHPDSPIFQTCRWLYGYAASFDEGRIFEDWMDTLGACTIKGLMVANEDLENTGNKMVELVESDIIEETTSQISDFESLTVLPDYNDRVSPNEAYDGFHFYAFWRIPDGWSPQSGLALTDTAIDGNYAIRAWSNQATIARGTKFNFNSVKLSAVLDGAQYNFKGYRGNNASPTYNVTYTINKTPRTITPGWTNLNRLVITQVDPTNKGPVVLENLNFTRKEYIPDLDNQTVNHLGYNSVFSIITQLRDGSRVITPVQQVNYAGLSGDIRIVHYTNGELYSFGMDNGGGSDTITQNDSSIFNSDSYTLDIGSTSSSYIDLWQGENTISVNDTSSTYTVLAEAVNSAVSAAGDPVNMAKGELYIEERPDFKIKGPGFDLSIIRQYKSQLVYNGPFGYGWTWNHAERIMPLTDDGALYYNNDGNSFEITKEDEAYTYPNGSTFSLEKNSDGFIITHHKSLNKSYFSTEGCLTKKEDLFGNTLVYEYANTTYPNRITKITDRLGRSLSFEYNTAGKVVKITDFVGQVLFLYLYRG